MIERLAASRRGAKPQAATQARRAARRRAAANTTPAQWAEEGFRAAKEHGYLNGTLPLANTEDDPDVTDIARAPEGYEENAGEVARFAVWKGGKRLAAVLREVVAAN